MIWLLYSNFTHCVTKIPDRLAISAQVDWCSRLSRELQASVQLQRSVHTLVHC